MPALLVSDRDVTGTLGEELRVRIKALLEANGFDVESHELGARVPGRESAAQGAGGCRACRSPARRDGEHGAVAPRCSVRPDPKTIDHDVVVRWRSSSTLASSTTCSPRTDKGALSRPVALSRTS